MASNVVLKRKLTGDEPGSKKQKELQPLPMRSGKPPKHLYQVMSCFLDFSTSVDATKKTPCLVQLPVIRTLANDTTGRWKEMKPPESGVFLLPDTPTKHLNYLPSFQDGNRVPELDLIVEQIKDSKKYQVLFKVLRSLDEGMLLDSRTGNFVSNGFRYFDDGRRLTELMQDYGYTTADEQEELRSLAKELPTLLRDALIHRNEDKKGRTFWNKLLTVLSKLVVDWIKKDKEDHKLLKEYGELTQQCVEKLGAARTEKQLKKAEQELGKADNLMAELMASKRDYVKANEKLYVPADFHLAVEVPNNSHRIYYEFISHDMDEPEMADWIDGAFPATGKDPDMGKRKAMEYIAKLLRKRDPMQWPWCKLNHLDSYCRIPQSYRQVDTAVVYNSTISEVTQWKLFKLAPFLGEVHGWKPTHPWSAIIQESSHTCIYVPKCYGMVVFKDTVHMMEFRRDPENSCIEAHSVELLMNGNGNLIGSIGLDVTNIMYHIVQSLVYGFLADLPETTKHFKTLLEDGYAADLELENKEYQNVCKCCWHFQNYADIQDRLEQPAEWERRRNDHEAAQVPDENDDSNDDEF